MAELDSEQVKRFDKWGIWWMRIVITLMLSLLPHLALQTICDLASWELPGWLYTLFLVQLGATLATAFAGLIVSGAEVIRGERCQN